MTKTRLMMRRDIQFSDAPPKIADSCRLESRVLGSGPAHHPEGGACSQGGIRRKTVLATAPPGSVGGKTSKWFPPVAGQCVDPQKTNDVTKELSTPSEGAT